MNGQPIQSLPHKPLPMWSPGTAEKTDMELETVPAFATHGSAFVHSGNISSGKNQPLIVASDRVFVAG